jgi:Protein of unknown function (DUF2845)
MACALTGWAPLAAAGGGLFCGTRVITTGMQAAEVGAACGEPAEVTHDAILRRQTIWRQGRPWTSHDPVEVPVERWLYNFGPNRLMCRLRFDDGVLVEITTLGYGYNP